MTAASLLYHRCRVLAFGLAHRALIVGIGQMTYIAYLGLGISLVRLRCPANLRLFAHAQSISLSMTKGKR
jgi:hypothetical protein